MDINSKHNLRTFDNMKPLYFETDPNFDHKRMICFRPKNITSKSLYYIENALTNLECETLIKNSGDLYESLKREFPQSERDSNRVLSIDPNFADILFSRLKPFILEDDKLEGITPCGFGIRGKWIPNKINPCFRYNQYVSPSMGFKPHRDATYIENEDIRSILSVLIYLNDDFENGRTIFYKTKGKRDKTDLVQNEMDRGYRERFVYKPKKGSILIFNHNMIHEGERVDFGSKYLVRTDIVFKRVERPKNYDYSWRLNPDFLQAIKYYREAMNQELDGNLEVASIFYQRELALRQCNKEQLTAVE